MFFFFLFSFYITRGVVVVSASDSIVDSVVNCVAITLEAMVSVDVVDRESETVDVVDGWVDVVCAVVGVTVILVDVVGNTVVDVDGNTVVVDVADDVVDVVGAAVVDVVAGTVVDVDGNTVVVVVVVGNTVDVDVVGNAVVVDVVAIVVVVVVVGLKSIGKHDEFWQSENVTGSSTLFR